jgi:hypothetical protein
MCRTQCGFADNGTTAPPRPIRSVRIEPPAILSASSQKVTSVAIAAWVVPAPGPCAA